MSEAQHEGIGVIYEVLVLVFFQSLLLRESTVIHIYTNEW